MDSKKLIDLSQDFICTTNYDGKFVFVNQACFAIFGYTEDELKSIDFINLVHPENRKKVQTALQSTIQGTSSNSFEVKCQHKNGNIIYISWKASLEPEEQLIYAIGRDITESKKAEDQLELTNLHLQQSSRIAKIGSWEIDLLTNEAYFSEETFNIYELTPPKVPSIDDSIKYYSKESRAIITQCFDEAIKNNTPYDVELPFITATGRKIWVRTQGEVQIKNGKPIRLYGTIQDVTKSKAIERKLKQNTQLLEASQRIGQLGGWELDIESNELFWTNETYRIHDSNPNEFNPTVDAGVGYFLPESKRIISEALEKAINKGEGYDLELETYTTKGRKIHVRTTCEVTLFKGKPVKLTGTFQDITERKFIEKELTNAKNKAEEINANITAIIEGTNNSIWAYNKKFELSYINEAFQQDFLQSFGVLLEPGVNLIEALPEKIRKIWKERYNRVLANEQFTIEEAVPTENGMIYIQASFNPIKKQGEVIGGSCIGSNITERKLAEIELIKAKEKAEENKIKLKQSDRVFNLTLDMFCIAGFDGYFKYLNPAWERILGWTIDELLSKPWLEFVHPDDVEKTKNVKSIIVGGKEVYKFNNRYICKDGSIKWFSWNSQPFPNENIMIGAVRDITETKRIENELLQAKEKAEESDMLKTAFLTNMSHEIRTPLNAVLGFSELLLKTDISETDKQTYANYIRLNGDSLAKIIDDIIDISKLKLGYLTIHKTNFNLNLLFGELLDYYNSVLLQRNKAHVKLELLSDINHEEEFYINTDNQRLKQVLNNLISNAIKFTEKGSVTFGYDINEEQINFMVKDTGYGIAPEKISQIFDRFVHFSPQYVSKNEGTGLGLSISKSLVSLLGGELNVDSELHKGSNFYFSLPLVYAEKPKGLKKSSTLKLKPKLYNCRILIADDEDSNYVLTKRVIKQTKVITDWAQNGQHAVEMASNTKYDLIIMDLKMPVMDGFEATRQIKKMHKDLPIIVQTAFAMKEIKDKALKAGCDGFIVKPITLDAFVELVNKHINSK